MIRSFIIPTSLVALTACGGSGAAPDAGRSLTPVVVPLSETGFAQDGVDLGDYWDFNVQSAIRIISNDTDELSFDRQDLSVSGDLVAGSMLLVIDGRTYSLPRSPDVDFLWEYARGDDQVLFQTFAGGSNVVAMSEVYAEIDGNFNAAYLVFGYDTDPDRIAILNNDVTYDGRVLATLRNRDIGASFGDGRMRMNVDFGTGFMSGTATVAQTGGEFLNFDPITFGFEETRISQNGFEGDVSLLLGDIEGTLQQSGYEGRFYGTDATSIAGTLFGRIDVNGVDADTFVEAAFVANLEDPD